MLQELVPLNFDKIMQTKSYTVIVLSNKDKNFAIYTDPNVGKTLQLFLTGAEKPRPLSHDLFHMTLQAMEISVMQVVIYDLQETVYYAKLFLEQQVNGIRHILEIDSRPSDSIILALMNNAPVYCTKEVLDKAIPLDL